MRVPSPLQYYNADSESFTVGILAIEFGIPVMIFVRYYCYASLTHPAEPYAYTAIEHNFWRFSLFPYARDPRITPRRHARMRPLDDHVRAWPGSPRVQLDRDLDHYPVIRLKLESGGIVRTSGPRIVTASRFAGAIRREVRDDFFIPAISLRDLQVNQRHKVINRPIFKNARKDAGCELSSIKTLPHANTKH
jgi:hypothetical protein